MLVWVDLNHEDADATSYRYNGRNELIQTLMVGR